MTTFAYNGSDLDITALKSQINEELSIVRAATLDRFQKQSPGVSRVYQENIVAAQRYKRGEITPLSNGMNPTDYLKGFGSKIGMHESQFADYVLYENQRLGIQAYSVEQKYLEGRGILGSINDGDIIIAWFEGFKAFCVSITGN